jgi:anti-sigma-K factor RskA
MHTNPEVLALLALAEDVGTPAERLHVESCPTCSEEVAELARIADVGRSSTTSDLLSAPSPEVWARITAELGFDAPAQLASVTPAESRPAAAATTTPAATVTDLAARRVPAGPGGNRPTSAARRFLALAVAAALALVVGIGVGIGYERQVTKPENRVIASANLTPLPKFAGAAGTAEVLADGRGGRELVVKMTSPQPINGTVQVWLMDDRDQATSMGTMKDGVARLPIPRGMSLFERPTVDISAEPAADTNPGLNGESILRGKLI